MGAGWRVWLHGRGVHTVAWWPRRAWWAR